MGLFWNELKNGKTVEMKKSLVSAIIPEGSKGDSIFSDKLQRPCFVFEFPLSIDYKISIQEG